MDDQIIQSQTFQNLLFLFEGVQQFDVHIFLQYHSWMREKGEDRGFESGVFGIVCDAFQYLTVAQMHTIKCADGHHSLMRNLLKMRNVLDCFQLI